MKHFVLTAGLVLAGLLPGRLAAQTNAAAQPEMTFQSEVYDYGEIKQGANGDCEFRFTNTGTGPLIISNAKGSCQCTVPSWPKKPIQPGETAIIKVHYNTNRPGPINKTVTIEANIEGGTRVLRIKGHVLAAETAGAPVNPAQGPRSE